MNLSEEQIKDFLKKAAFIADSSTCNFKVGSVLVQSRNNANKNINFDEISKKESNLRSSYKFKNGLDNNIFYIKTSNESLPGECYCQDKTKQCIREELNLKGKDFQIVCSIHAESNAIAKFAKYGLSTLAASIFVTNFPCYICSKLIVQSGITNVYYIADHVDMLGKNLFKANGVKVINVPKNSVFN